MNSILRKIIIGFVMILLIGTMGLYTGIKNTTDYNIESLTFPQISQVVKVYRDSRGFPTIVAQNEKDLFFAQGYEIARDRLWQLEFFRSVGSGELSRLFGPGTNNSLINADMYLRTLSMRSSSYYKWSILDQQYKDIINSFIDGINTYIELHQDNLPLEFYLLGVKPLKWTPEDVLAIQGVMSRTLSLSGMSHELLRQDLATYFGAKKSLDLLPIQYAPAAQYFENLNFTNTNAIKPNTAYDNNTAFQSVLNVIGQTGIGLGLGSNDWVVGPSKTTTGTPILANDPHLDLTTPSIWWQVQLYCPTFHVEGFSLPGVPGIIIGHNDKVTWGMTNTETDTLDLFYFKTSQNGSQYYYNGAWHNFTLDRQTIQVKGEKSVTFTIKRTDIGPVLSPDLFDVPTDKTYVMRWALIENNPNNKVIQAVIDLNRAQNAQDIHNALKYFFIPGQNFVFATVDGGYGYQYTGYIPIRKNNNYGIIPQNGSSPDIGWTGYVPYQNYYYVTNPSQGFFVTANQKVDTRDNFYITDLYDLPYRANRITELLNTTSKLSIQDIQNIQKDTVNLYAKNILTGFLPGLKKQILNNPLNDPNAKLIKDALNILIKWAGDGYHMARKEVGATIFATFSIYLAQFTFQDEMNAKNPDLYAKYANSAPYALSTLSSNLTSPWFDNISTTNIVENGSDIAKTAFIHAIDYLRKTNSKYTYNWAWSQVHQVTFVHAMGSALPFLNEGGQASDGSRFTIMASGGAPRWSSKGPQFSQTNGPSMRYVVEVSSTWPNTYAIVAPGESGHLLNPHRGDGVKDWINNVYYKWDYYIYKENKNPSFVYEPKSS